jgi:hypothetical protein
MEMRLIQDRRTTRIRITRVEDGHGLLVGNARNDCDAEPLTFGAIQSQFISIREQE